MDGDSNNPTAVATPPPDNPSTPPSGTADLEARASANSPAATGAPGSTEDLEAKATVARTQPAPVSVVPAPPPRPKRGGIAGVVDDMADALAGTKGTPQVRQDAEGNLLIEHPALSRKGQWLKIAAEAFRGAAAGAAHMQGPGAAGRGLEAGAEAGEKMAEQQRQQQQQQSQEVRQANQDLFNSIKLKHDMAAKDFELSRMKVKATQDDIDFAQSQLDREKKLGSADLGVFKDEADLARVKDQNPNFWKDVYKNNMVAIPEVDEKGNRQGIHVFLRTPGIGSQLVEPGTPIRIWDAGKHEMTTQTPTVPMTHNMLDAYNAAADNQQKQWHIDQNEEEFKKQQTQTSEAEEESHRATAAKSLAEAKQLNEATSANAIQSNAQQMVEGNIDPSQLSKRSKSYDATLQAANAYSMQKYGKPFDLTSAASDYKYSNNTQTQNTLKMIQGMTEPGGAIEIAQSAAKSLPKLPERTVNKVFNAVASEFGSKEATDFHTAMLGLADEYSKVMGGGTATDTGRQQGLDLLKASYSNGQLQGAIDIMRQDIAARQKALVGSNRYLLRQYAPPRPQNVPPNYVHRDGPSGIGWYAP